MKVFLVVTEQSVVHHDKYAISNEALALRVVIGVIIAYLHTENIAQVSNAAVSDIPTNSCIFNDFIWQCY